VRTDDERRDLSHIAMVACVFGCDALYETGYLTLDTEGRIRGASFDGESAVVQRLAELEDRTCPAFGPGSAKYFEGATPMMRRGVDTCH
jgi:hypothetical protein